MLQQWFDRFVENSSQYVERAAASRATSYTQYVILETDWTGSVEAQRRTTNTTLPSQWFLASARLRVSTTAAIAQIPGVSSKDGAVIGAVLGTRKFHH
jgi:hypothetical protein